MVLLYQKWKKLFIEAVFSPRPHLLAPTSCSQLGRKICFIYSSLVTLGKLLVSEVLQLLGFFSLIPHGPTPNGPAPILADFRLSPPDLTLPRRSTALLRNTLHGPSRPASYSQDVVPFLSFDFESPDGACFQASSSVVMEGQWSNASRVWPGRSCYSSLVHLLVRC